MRFNNEPKQFDIVYCKYEEDLGKYVALISSTTGDKHKKFFVLKKQFGDKYLTNDIPSPGLKNNILNIFSSFEEIIEKANESEMIRIFDFLINIELSKNKLIKFSKVKKEKNNIDEIFNNFSCFETSLENTFIKFKDNEKIRNNFIKSGISRVLSHSLKIKNFKIAFNKKDDKMIKETLEYINMEDLKDNDLIKLNEYFQDSMDFHSILKMTENSINILKNNFFTSVEKNNKVEILSNSIFQNMTFLKDTIKDFTSESELKKYLTLLSNNEKYINKDIEIPNLYIRNTFKKENDDLEFINILYKNKMNDIFDINTCIESKDIDSFLDKKLIFNNEINPNIKILISLDNFPKENLFNYLNKHNKELLNDEFITNILKSFIDNLETNLETK